MNDSIKKAEISLCMIVKNEELVLERCLNSVKDIVDEIIIVDTGSTDKTKEIAYKFTSKVYDFEWVDDFSKARNFSFSKATKEYIMWLDADDVIEENDAKKILELKNNIDPNVDIYMFIYNYSFDSNGNPKVVQKRARILKKSKNYTWVSPIHEIIVPSGNIVYTDICVNHKKIKINDKDRNLRIFKKMESEGKDFDIRQGYSYAHEYFYRKDYDKTISMLNTLVDKYENTYSANSRFLYKSLLVLADCYKNKNDFEMEEKSLFKIIKYQKPGIKACNRLGDLFYRKKNFEATIFWLQNAIALEDIHEDVNIIEHYYTPNLLIGASYFYLKDYDNAIKYNNFAWQIMPNSIACKKNNDLYIKKKNNL